MPRRITLLAVLFLVGVVLAALLITRKEPAPPGAADLVGVHREAAPTDDPRNHSALGEERTPEPLSLSPASDRSADVGPSALDPEPVRPVLPEAPLIVEVVHRAGGNPVPGAHVRVTSTDSITREILSEVTARTNNAGVCRVTPLLGTLSVAVWTAAHEYGRGTLQHNGGGELARIRVEVERLATVSGIVRDPAGQPIDGARVSSFVSRGIDAAAVTSDHLGRFEFHDWPMDTISVLSFDAEGYGKEGVTLVVEDDRWCLLGMSDEYDWREGAPFVEVVLAPEGIIRGTLVDSEGKPVDDGNVRASGVVESSSRILLGDVAEAVTRPDGSFELRGLRLDVPHLVMCDAPSKGVAVRAAESSPAGSIDLGTIPLSGSGRVTGRFVDRWERSISGALLELTLPDIRSLVPGGVDASTFFGNPSRLVSSSQVSSNGDFEVGGARVDGLQLAVKLGLRTLWEAPIDLGMGNVDLGTVRLETEIQLITGHLITPDDAPARLDIIDSHGRLWARIASGRNGGFSFATMDGRPRRVTIVQRSEEGLPINRWTRDIREFPVTLQAK